VSLRGDASVAPSAVDRKHRTGRQHTREHERAEAWFIGELVLRALGGLNDDGQILAAVRVQPVQRLKRAKLPLFRRHGAAGASFAPGTSVAGWDGMKNIVICALAGILLGVAVASLVVPPALSWYTEPGGLPKGAQIQAIVEIPKVIRYATGRLMRGQIIGGGIGGVLGLVAGMLIIRKSRTALVPAATKV
jgi:hypothetical protein